MADNSDKKFVRISAEEFEKYQQFQQEKSRKEKTTIQIRISKEKKDLWEAFSKKNRRFKNLSHLIRVAVDDYLFPETSGEQLSQSQVPVEFEESVRSSLSKIDNWNHFQKIRELEELVKKFNKIAKKECEKEKLQKKLLEIQHALISVILEISALVN